MNSRVIIFVLLLLLLFSLSLTLLLLLLLLLRNNKTELIKQSINFYNFKLYIRKYLQF